MKQGDIRIIYGGPMKEQYPIGKAQLIELIEDYETLQHWKVKFIDGPISNVLIKA